MKAKGLIQIQDLGYKWKAQCQAKFWPLDQQDLLRESWPPCSILEAKVNGNDNQTTMVIEAMEKREMAVVDVTSAFMQVNMDELVQMRFTGKMEELLLEIDKDMY